jgi:hypothetical protein
MKTPKSAFLALGFVFLFTSPPGRADASECASEWERPTSGVPRSVPGDLLTFLRSNPAWSWSWFRANQKNYLSVFDGVASLDGVVGGDVKPDNVGFISLAKNQIGFGLIDLDDGGRGPLMGDLFQTLSYNEAWHTPLSLEEALDFYLSGLKGKSQKKVSALREELLLSLPTAGPGEWQRSLEKYVGDQAAFFKKFKLVSLAETSACTRKLWSSVGPALMKSLNGREVLQMGARIKDSGGSAGVPRFVLLTKSPGGLDVIEFKLQVAPGVSAAGAAQLSAPARIDELNRFYRGVGPGERGYLKTFTASGLSFLVRSREKILYDAGDIPESAKKIARHKDFVRVMFHWLGERHASQSDRYRRILTSDEASLIVAMKRMTRAHHDEARRLAQDTQRSLRWREVPSGDLEPAGVSPSGQIGAALVPEQPEAR